MTVCFTSYVHDPARGAWTLPRSRALDSESFGVDVSNANAVDLLLVLGLDPTPCGDPMPIEAFANLVTAALRRHLGKRSPALPAIKDAQPGRLTIVHLGRREGYIEATLGALMHVIHRGRENGATHFGWG